jgi:predicted nucleic acid-binding protein
MRAVFADTTFYVAILNPGDQYAEKAAQFAAEYSGCFVTTTFILAEVCNMLSAPRFRENAWLLAEEMEVAVDTDLIHPDWSLWKRACNLYGARPDKFWSLKDCLSFVVMQDRELTEALTADHHFEQAGFAILLK